MDNLLTLALEAHNNGLNHHRRYEIQIGRDLLDHWTLTIGYGRVGQGQQVKRFAAKEEGCLQVIIRERIQRRLSATKRIGCRYQIVTSDKATNMNSEQWLPAELLAKLL